MVESAFLRYAGKKAEDISPAQIKRREGSGLLYLDEYPFHEQYGYLVPCTGPELYTTTYESNGNALSSEEETTQRQRLTQDLTRRYFNFVERGTRIPATYEQITALKSQYEDATPEEKEHWGALLVGSIVYRMRRLSEALLQHPNDRESGLEPQAPSFLVELKEHFTTFFMNKELGTAPRLDGNKHDHDCIVRELVSELTKPAGESGGQRVYTLRGIADDRVENIGKAMRKIDQTHESILAILRPQSPLGALIDLPLDENGNGFSEVRVLLKAYTDAARVRVALPKTDFEDYPAAEVRYRVARDRLDAKLEELRQSHSPEVFLKKLGTALDRRSLEDAGEAYAEYGHRITFLSQLEAVQEGRRLIDDMCYYRDPMPKTLNIFREKNGLNPTPAMEPLQPSPSLHVRGGSTAPIRSTEKDSPTPGGG